MRRRHRILIKILRTFHALRTIRFDSILSLLLPLREAVARGHIRATGFHQTHVNWMNVRVTRN